MTGLRGMMVTEEELMSAMGGMRRRREAVLPEATESDLRDVLSRMSGEAYPVGTLVMIRPGCGDHEKVGQMAIVLELRKPDFEDRDVHGLPVRNDHRIVIRDSDGDFVAGWVERWMLEPWSPS